MGRTQTRWIVSGEIIFHGGDEIAFTARPSMADCAASPALFYAQRCQAWGDRPKLQAHHDRLEAPPSFARAPKEAPPFVHMFPDGPDY